MLELALAFLTLTVLEIVLGIDNIVFISLLTGRLPAEERNRARLVGLGVAMGARIALLLSISYVMKLVDPLFIILEQEISGKDLILILGGVFLLYKSVSEIHARFDETKHGAERQKKVSTFAQVILQIVIIDIVFSLDSVITAVGMADEIGVMIAAVVVAVIFMMFFSKAISDFVEKYHSIKILALAFLVMIGVLLVAEGFDKHIPKGYVYFAMAFSIGVEMINIKLDKRYSLIAGKMEEDKVV